MKILFCFKLDFFSLYFSGILVNLVFILVFFLVKSASTSFKRSLNKSILSYSLLLLGIIFSSLRETINTHIAIFINNLATLCAYVGILSFYLDFFPHRIKKYLNILVAIMLIPAIGYLIFDFGFAIRALNYSLFSSIPFLLILIITYRYLSDLNVKVIFTINSLILLGSIIRPVFLYLVDDDPLFLKENSIHNIVFIIIYVLILIQAGIMLSTLTKKRLEDEKREANQNKLLVTEMNHRVANSINRLITILEMDRLSVNNEEDKNKLLEVQNRLFTISSLHKELYTYKKVNIVNIEKYFEELTQNILSSFEKQGITIEINIEPILMDPDKTTYLGIILNELIMNTIKYVDTNNSNEVIRIAMSSKLSKNNMINYSLSYYSSGKTMKIESSTGFGSIIIDNSLKLLNGTSKTNLSPNSYYFEMEFSIHNH